jgi:Fe-S oxidoreductase
MKNAYSFNMEMAKAEVLYYLGPNINFKNKEIADAMLKILKRSSICFTTIKNEPSSGKILSLLGYEDEAKKKAEELYERIMATGCKTIVTGDPLAYYAFKNDYKDFGLKLEPDIKIKHTAGYLNELRVKTNAKFKKIKKKVTLVDSEYIGRFSNNYEEARQLLRSISDSYFTEMRWNKEKMLATGEAAFYFSLKNIDKSKYLGAKIYDLAKDIGIEMMITLSAEAKNNIKKAISNDIDVLDISEYYLKMII